MISRDTLQGLYARWRLSRLQREMVGVEAVLQDFHTRWVERPNLYVELDLGTKRVRYPDGKVRSVRAREVRDTAGVRFVVFDPSTPLS